jgi:hypothetical protein
MTTASVSLAQRAARAAMIAEALAAQAAKPSSPSPSSHPLAVLGRPERQDLGSQLDLAA